MQIKSQLILILTGSSYSLIHHTNGDTNDWERNKVKSNQIPKLGQR